MAQSRITETIVDPISDPRSTTVPIARRDPPNFGEIKEVRSGNVAYILFAFVVAIFAVGYYYFWDRAPLLNETNALQTTQPVQPVQ